MYNQTGNAMHCNVTFRCICATTAAVEKQYVLHIVSVYLWPSVSSKQCACTTSSSIAAQFYNHFPHYPIRGTIFVKKKKIHKNASSGSQVVPCKWTNRRTDMIKLIVASHNFANVPTKNVHIVCVCVCVRAHILLQ
jgi:hypothetical protein